jgi:hypothetical protein
LECLTRDPISGVVWKRGEMDQKMVWYRKYKHKIPQMNRYTLHLMIERDMLSKENYALRRETNTLRRRCGIKGQASLMPGYTPPPMQSQDIANLPSPTYIDLTANDDPITFPPTAMAVPPTSPPHVVNITFTPDLPVEDFDQALAPPREGCRPYLPEELLFGLDGHRIRNEFEAFLCEDREMRGEEDEELMDEEMRNLLGSG